jgi:hypothetical protein
MSEVMWQGVDADYRASWESAMESLRARAAAAAFTEDELSKLLRRQLENTPAAALAAVRIAMEIVPGLRGQAERALQFLPTRQKRILLAALPEPEPEEEPVDDGLPWNWDLPGRRPGDPEPTEITPPSVWWKSPSDPMLHIVTHKPVAPAGASRRRELPLARRPHDHHRTGADRLRLPSCPRARAREDPQAAASELQGRTRLPGARRRR